MRQIIMLVFKGLISIVRYHLYGQQHQQCMATFFPFVWYFVSLCFSSLYIGSMICCVHVAALKAAEF